ncbi:MAG: preprotein translocase subunit SecG [Clostridia bacterium]|nr:preprotein translocase subunit SecG [Clostridia bacterium]
MNIVENVLIIVYAILSIVLIAICLMQSKDDEGASATVVGGSSSGSFYEKNKGRTKEGKLKKWTIILGIVYIILTIVLGIVYML